MLNATIIILLAMALPILLKRLTENNYAKIKADCEYLALESDKLTTANAGMREVNSRLKNDLEATIALYDITKEICKSLDEDKVCGNFCELIKSYVRVEECKFVKEGELPARDNKHTIFPLNIYKDTTAYLVTSGLSREDEERFHILAGQFLLGIKRFRRWLLPTV